jgi:site-specific recombinase XerD
VVPSTTFQETIMNEHLFPNPAVRERLQAGPLSTYVDAFAEHLLERGYATWTVKYAMRLLAGLSEWLAQAGWTAANLNEATIEAFLQRRYRSRRPHRDDRAIIAAVMAHLREVGALPLPVDPPADNAERARVCEAFRQHLVGQRHLAQPTRRTYVDTVRHFLDWCFGSRPIELRGITAHDVTGFMVDQARRYSAGHTQLIASALRSFLRFLRQTGAIAVDLAQNVPAPARRQLSGLPKFMPAEDVERLVRSVDRTGPQGLRNYAIVLLLARLGLRAGEVAALRLEDVDWEAGELVIRGKSGRIERLPLPWDVGEALGRYLREARPICSIRQIFVCLRAPRRGFRNGNAVGTVVRRALNHTDLQPPHRGAHLLRHSLATRLLRDGASLTEIGELLRHRHLDTTRIYAKVDDRALAPLALPWPGGGQ